jgi:23S rRNA pseudouridine1911/1915/1917 synthase
LNEIASTHIVPENISGLRLTEYLLKYGKPLLGSHCTRNYIKKLIKAGNIIIDGCQAATANWVETGQKIELILPDIQPRKIYQMEMPVIFEDEHLAVIDKPAGIMVSGNCFRTVENALLHNISASILPEALSMPRPVHRLDALTSGLLLIAKTHPVRIALGEMFAKHQISKTYQAIVIGKTPSQHTISFDVQGKCAVTNYSTIRQTDTLRGVWLSLLELNPETGRTHQLRIHLSQSGFPILGDKLYGTVGNIFRGKGLFLSATGLQFVHPITSHEIVLKIDPPAKFKIHLDRVEKRFMVLGRS